MERIRYPWYSNDVESILVAKIMSGKIHALYLQAMRLAKQSEHYQPMAAIALKGGAVVSRATNGSKFGLHAEWRALRGKGEADTIIVARHNGGMSRPCLECQDVLKARGVSKMIYANRLGELICEKL